MLKEYSIAAAAAASFFMAAEAGASTVVLTLDRNDGAELMSLELVEDYPYIVPSFRGVVAQNGFEIEFQVTGPGVTEASLGEATEYASVSTCRGRCAGSQTVDYLSFSRPDGATFSLMELDVRRTAVDSFAEVFVTPPDDAGEPDWRNQEKFGGPTFGDNLKFSGTKANGQAAGHVASSYASAPDQTYPDSDVYSFGSTTLDLGANADLIDLTSLRLEATGFANNEQHLRYLDQRGELPEILAPLLESYSSCAASFNEGVCVVGNAFFQFIYSDTGTRNYQTAPGFSSFTFAVEDVTQPSPVPLPGTGALGLAALAAFGFVARRGRRG